MKRSSTKALALLLMTAVLLAALTTAALAAPADVDIASGSITIGDGTYAQGSGEAPIPEGGLVITGTSDSNTIIVDPGDGKTAAFTISDLALSTESGASLIDVKSGSAVITLAGENTLTGGGAGALLAETDAPGEALGIDVQKGKIAVLYSEGAAVYNKNLTERGESTEASGAAALLLRADGETVTVFPGTVRYGLV